MSRQQDDYESSIDTTGILNVGGKTNGRFCLPSRFMYRDDDWFKIELKANQIYRFHIEYLSYAGWSASISLKDHKKVGDRMESVNVLGSFVSVDPNNESILYVTPEIDKTYYLSVVGANVAAGYFVRADNVADVSGDKETVGLVRIPVAVKERITSKTDNDWFRVEAVAKRQYRAKLNLDTLAGTRLNIFYQNGNRIQSIKPSTNGMLDFQFNDDRTIFVAVESTGARGKYQLELETFDDRVGTFDTTSEFKYDSRGVSRLYGDIEKLGDRDWIKVNLKAGRTYRFWHSDDRDRTHQGRLFNRLARIVDSDGNVLAKFNDAGTEQARSLDFKAPETGDYFYVINSVVKDYATPESGTGRYELVFQQLRVAAWPRRRMIVDGNSVRWGQGYNNMLQPILRSTLSAHPTFTKFEIYSTVALDSQGVTIAPNQRKILSVTDFGKVKVPKFGGSGNVFIRGFQRGWTQWGNINVSSFESDQSIDVSRFKTANTPGARFVTVKYRFENALPTHWQGQPVHDFRELTVAQKSAFETIFEDWEDTLGIHIRAANSDEDADISLFAANRFEFVDAFMPGANGETEQNRGGDIIISRHHYSTTNSLRAGTQPYFELVRAVGTSLGIGETSFLHRGQSVMGRRNDSSLNGLPWASTPLFDDQLLTPRIFGEYEGQGHSDILQMQPGEQFYKSMYRGRGIDASSHNISVSIDLRPGKKSTASMGQTIVNVPSKWDSFIPYLAVGGSRGDRLTGNEGENTLTGNAGNDILIGMEGDDTLQGGANSDKYIYRFGDGFDRIQELGSGGRDVLQIKGYFDLDDVKRDLAFANQEGDLLINLDLGNARGGAIGQVRIVDFQDRASQVETLELFDGSRKFARLNLNSVFAQATEDFQRFKLATKSDKFGSFLTPFAKVHLTT